MTSSSGRDVAPRLRVLDGGKRDPGPAAVGIDPARVTALRVSLRLRGAAGRRIAGFTARAQRGPDGTVALTFDEMPDLATLRWLARSFDDAADAISPESLRRTI